MNRLFLVFLAGCVPPWPEDGSGDGIPLDEIKAGFLYVGPVGDHGWSKTHDDGRLALEENLGVATGYEPSVNPADANTVIDGMMADGYNVVFTTSFDYVSQTQQAAADYPDADFLSCSGGVSADNLSSYMARMYQPMYLAGMVAGGMTSTNRLGMVVSVPIPEIARHINAFTLGAREINPEVVVEVKWINDWFDADLETAYTNELIARGADVITNQTDTTIPIETAVGQVATYDDGSGAVETPVYTIGYDNPDSCAQADENCLTSAYWNWGPMYTSLVTQISDGTWDPSNILWEQMQSTPELSAVSLSDYSTVVPGALRLAVDDKIPELAAADGSHLPFVGPIKDSGGGSRVASGDTLSDEELNRMCWLVEGVVSNDGSGDEPAVVPSGCDGDE